MKKILLRYGIVGCSKLLISYVMTKLFYSKARLIRFPIDVRNKRAISFGNDLTTGLGCRIEAYPAHDGSVTLFIGDHVEINDYVHISAGEKIVIGNNVLIASKVFISDINHGSYKGENQDSPISKPNERLLSTLPITICDNVWIGEGVCIMPGVRIGVGSIIGASSVVTHDIPDHCIAVGTPARPIKKYDFITMKWIKLKEFNDV
jgi:acetyltransferase-like isoleucine patch superfamily enzyme